MQSSQRSLLALWAGLCAVARGAPSACPAGEAACGAGARPSPYHWPMQKGDPGRTGYSSYVMPPIAAGPTWNWSDPHEDVIRATPLIDGERNIYLSTIGGRIYKFSPAGTLLWTHVANKSVKVVPALMDGALFTNLGSGHVLAIDMDTGKQRWRVQVAKKIAGDTASMFVADGVVVCAVISPLPLDMHDPRNTRVVALNSADGSRKWDFTPDVPVYNFQAATSGDGTIVFQDQSGGLYRLDLDDGRPLWRSGNLDRGQFSTGAAVLHSGLVYVTSNVGNIGILHVYKHSSGQLEWMQFLPYPANQAVAVGELGSDGTVSAVVGIGANPGLAVGLDGHLQYDAKAGKFVPEDMLAKHQHSLANPLNHSVPLPRAMMAFDAKTGELQWRFDMEPWHHPATLGDNERLLARLRGIATDNPHNDGVCLPDSCSQPVIDGSGTVFVGWEDGVVYAVRDKDADGAIARESEVSSYPFSDGFQGSLAMAPGMLAVAPCGGGLYVYVE